MYTEFEQINERNKLVKELRKVYNNKLLEKQTVVIPEGCEYMKEGTYDIQSLLHFIADMIE